MRLLYIFPSERKAPSADMPATQLYGFDHLRVQGITPEALGRDDALPWLMASWLGSGIGFKLRHALLYFKARNYDVVFGPALVYLMPFKKIFGGRARYVALNIELVRMLRGNMKRSLRRRIIESLLGELAGIVCLAHAQKDWLLTHYPTLAGKVFVVPLAADTVFYPAVYEGRNETVLSVGADDGRDYETLCEAARRLPDTQFEIVCSPRNLVEVTSVPSNVLVYHDLPLGEVKAKYQTARMIVIPTHDDARAQGADCSGQTVLLDAMASGLPIIVSRKAYIADYVRDGQDALVVDCYNPRELVEAITRLSDGALRNALAKSARTRAEDDLSSEAMAESLTHIFKNLWNN